MHGLAHVTGGGLPGNLARVLPAGCDAVVDRGSWPVPRIFAEVQRRGEVDDDEMARVFNLGIGMVAVVPAGAVAPALAVLADHGHDAVVIGTVTAGSGGVRYR